MLRAVWTKALVSFLADESITEDEAAYLKRLRVPLGVTDREVADIERQLVHPRYKRVVDEVLSDGRVTEEERRVLRSMAANLRLGEDTEREIYRPAADDALNDAALRAIEDNRLSPDEESRFQVLAQELGIQFRPRETTVADLAKASMYWRIENGQPPEYDVPIALQRGEKCHFASNAVWNELRTRTVRVNYSGPTASIRICKGVRYRFGSIAAQRVTRDELILIDEGTLYVTNKRIIFDGARKNVTIRYSALIAFQVCSDGLILEKTAGKSPHLVMDGDVQQAAVTLGAMLAQA